MRRITAVTVTNPNDNNDNFIIIKLSGTGQEVKALWVNPLILDHREQKPNVKIGTEVCVFVDEFYQYTVMGSTQQGITMVNKKTYLIENADKVSILTDKRVNISSINGGMVDVGTFKIKELDYKGNNAIITLNNNLEIALTKWKITNGADEIVALLLELIQAIIDEMHIVNLGRPTVVHPASKAKYRDIKSRLQAFKV